MNPSALASSIHLADRIAISEKIPAVLEPLLKHAVGRNVPICAMVNSSELGESLGEFVAESLCLAIVVPDASCIEWATQTTDWLIPHCEVNHAEKTVRALVMLGDGPLAVPTMAVAPLLFDTEQVFIVFATSQGTLAVVYRWNEKLLASLEAANLATERYEFDECQSARMISLGAPIFGCTAQAALVPDSVNLDADGTIQPTANLVEWKSPCD